MGKYAFPHPALHFGKQLDNLAKSVKEGKEDGTRVSTTKVTLQRGRMHATQRLGSVPDLVLPATQLSLSDCIAYLHSPALLLQAVNLPASQLIFTRASIRHSAALEFHYKQKDSRLHFHPRCWCHFAI